MKPTCYLTLLLLLICQLSFSQTRFEQAANSDLFTNEDPLAVTISTDIKEVTKDIEERASHEGTFTYIENGMEKTLTVKLKIRGNNRANPQVCSFPPMEVNFKKKEVVGTLFAGQDKLKLVTHCTSRGSATKYIMQEYLTYKQYNILTDYSFRVRWLTITYIDTRSGEKMEQIGFLIEDDKILAERMGMVKHKGKIYHQDQCLEEAVDLFTVFQYFIANTDWSISEGHNVKLISDSEKRVPIPIPYDFDNSGIINTHYAVPAESLGISSVRSRVFRGFCREEGVYEKTFAKFIDNKEALVGLYTNNETLSEKEIKNVVSYMEKFYETIQHNKKSQSEFRGSCRLAHDHRK